MPPSVGAPSCLECLQWMRDVLRSKTRTNTSATSEDSDDDIPVMERWRKNKKHVQEQDAPEEDISVMAGGRKRRKNDQEQDHSDEDMPLKERWRRNRMHVQEQDESQEDIPLAKLRLMRKHVQTGSGPEEVCVASRGQALPPLPQKAPPQGHSYWGAPGQGPVAAHPGSILSGGEGCGQLPVDEGQTLQGSTSTAFYNRGQGQAQGPAMHTPGHLHHNQPPSRRTIPRADQQFMGGAMRSTPPPSTKGLYNGNRDAPLGHVLHVWGHTRGTPLSPDDRTPPGSTKLDHSRTAQGPDIRLHNPLNPFISSSTGPPTSAGIHSRRAKMQKVLGGCVDGQEEETSRWSWLGADRKDCQGNPPGSPDYDPSTLSIPSHAWSTMNPFTRQFWGLKSRCMDLVLFVRHGSFYNLFDVDADVGLRVGLNISGKKTPNMWKVGCHKDFFAQWATKVLALGYNVGRVEECPGSKKADTNILKRKLVRIYTPGTAVEGGLEDTVNLDSRPFMTLVEEPGGMLGCTVLDVALGHLTCGLLSPSRRELNLALLQYNPVEVVGYRRNLSPGTLRMLRDCGVGRANETGGPMIGGASFTQWTGGPAVNWDELAGHLVHHGIQEDQLMALQALVGPTTCPSTGYQQYTLPAVALALQHLHCCGLSDQVLQTLQVKELNQGGSQVAQQAPMHSTHLLLDDRALWTLEVLQGSLGGLQGSLMGLLSAGLQWPCAKRKLRQWLCRPLATVSDIEQRLNVVDIFMGYSQVLQSFQSAVHQLPDLERLMPRAASSLQTLLNPPGKRRGAGTQDKSWLFHGLGPPLEGDEDQEGTGAGVWLADIRQESWSNVYRLVAGLLMCVEAVAQLRQDLDRQQVTSSKYPVIHQVVVTAAKAVKHLDQVAQVFDPASVSGPSGSPRQVTIPPGVDADHDRVSRTLSTVRCELSSQVDKDLAILGHWARSNGIVQVTGQDDGCYQVPFCGPGVPPPLPGGYLGVSVGGGRAVVRSLRASELQEMMGQAESQLELAVGRVMEATASQFITSYPLLSCLVDGVASLAVLAGFAQVTQPGNAPPGCSFSRPHLVETPSESCAQVPPLHLRDLWHPLLGATNSVIVCNDVLMGDSGEAGGSIASSKPLTTSCPGTYLLTGPNMGGKSTLLRAACLTVIMAQVGCYIPCSRATMSPVDRIFTRIGAHDQIMRGESTFMVEMSETAASLVQATPRSLVVLDELGRGTATYDGCAIASAVLQYLSCSVRCRTLLATHYHSLTRDPHLQPHITLAHMATGVSSGGAYVPLYKLRAGPAPQGSCGVEVAAVAGVPQDIIIRAQHMSRILESTDPGVSSSFGVHQQDQGQGGPAVLDDRYLDVLRQMRPLLRYTTDNVQACRGLEWRKQMYRAWKHVRGL